MSKKSQVLTVAQLIEKAINDNDKTQKEIAEELGYENPNIITMFKQGIRRFRCGRLVRWLGRSGLILLTLFGLR